MAPTSEERIIQEKLKELAALAEQREQIQAKMAKLEAAIRSFIELLEDDDDQKAYAAKLEVASRSPLGITESVKRALQQAKRLTAALMRDRLAESGFPLSGYSNPLAVVYTTMNRLVEQGFARKLEGGIYEWAKPAEEAPFSKLAYRRDVPKSLPRGTTLRNLMDLMDTRNKK